MIEHSPDAVNSILVVRPKSALEAARQWILGQS